MDHRILNRLVVAEKHLDLALDQIREENLYETKNLILNALSTIGQLQEILENEAQSTARLDRWREALQEEG
jgi:two-component sensor histidine kinase